MGGRVVLNDDGRMGGGGFGACRVVLNDDGWMGGGGLWVAGLC